MTLKQENVRRDGRFVRVSPVNIRNVDTPGHHVCAYQDPGGTAAELVEDLVSLFLHFPVDRE